MTNPYAIYVNCDGAMDYDSKNTGGIGFMINFPDSMPLEPITISIGRYFAGNIEIYELEALIQAMRKTLEVFEENFQLLKSIKQIIFITDRYGLREDDKTSAYKIREWRSNKWKNHEGKPIKKHKLLDELDKTRKKLSDKTYARISIEYRPRKQNKIADKLAKAGKKDGLIIDKLAKKSQKIGRRKYDGSEIQYSKLKEKDKLQVNVFRKDPVQDEWEIWVEVTKDERMGNKLKIYADDILAKNLQRGNEYIIRIKSVYSHHIKIFKTIKKISK
jgi:ribonuclease HI